MAGYLPRQWRRFTRLPDLHSTGQRSLPEQGRLYINNVPGVGFESSEAIEWAWRVPAGDALATRVFRELGYELDLIPPLVRSVILVGGYRCASQHLRAVRGARD